MLQTMSRYLRTALCWTFLSTVVLVGPMPQPVWAEDKKPLLLDVLLPADAELEVNGRKTKSTGETRQFESPPMSTERTYAYTLKVVWRGQTLTRRIELQPDKLKTLDLRDELQTLTAPKPKGSFALLVPPALTLAVDRRAVLPLRVRRFDFPDAIRVAFEGLPKGISAPETNFSEGRSEGHALLFAAADAVAGTHEIKVVAYGGDIKDEATIQITLIAPEKRPAPPSTPKPEPKPEIRPKPQPETKPVKAAEIDTALQLELPVTLELQAGRMRLLQVRVKTKNGSPLSEEPRVTLAAAGVRLHVVPWSSTFKAEQNSCTVGVAVRVEGDTVGEHEIRVDASAGKDKGTGLLKVNIKRTTSE